MAHVVLPIGSFAESSGTFVNAEGRWQSWVGAARLVGRKPAGVESVARARESAERARRRLRELGGSSRGACRTVAGARSAPFAGGSLVSADAVERIASAAEARRPEPWVDIPPYQVDVLVRGSESLAKTKDGHWPAP